MSHDEKVQSFKNVELVGEDFSAAPLPKIRDDFIAKLENALMFLSYKDLSMWHSECSPKARLKHFDGAWLVDVSLRHEDKEGFAFLPFTDLQVTPNMFPNLDIKIMNLSSELGSLLRYRFLSPKEKRNLQKFKYILSHKMAVLDYGKQKWWTDEMGYGFDNVNKNKEAGLTYAAPIPVSLKSGYRISPFHIKEFIKEGVKDEESVYATMMRSFHFSMQLALTYYYEWSCYIKETPDSLGVRIPIHPSSSKHVFMMRNIPEGARRKRAIVNFVKEHHRTITDFNNRERQILIRKHFRGDLKFNWRGLEVMITPSAYDLKRIKTSKTFRKF